MDVTLTSEEQLSTRHGVFSLHSYRGDDGSIALVAFMGRLAGGPALRARVHSSCFTSEGLHALDCDCVTQLDLALESIAADRRGVLFYLLQEGRGAGLANKIRDRALVQESAGVLDTFAAYEQLGLRRDPRSYALVPAICDALGIERRFKLLTNNPSKLRELRDAGIDVERIAHSPPPSRFNAEYVVAQAKNGYARAAPDAALRAAPSTPLRRRGAPEEEATSRVERYGRFRLVASYDMPVRGRGSGGAAWFRATAYTDDDENDRVVLTLGAAAERKDAPVHLFRETLVDRLTQAGESHAYDESVRRILEHGAGTLLAIPADRSLLTQGRALPSEADDLALLHAHRGGTATRDSVQGAP